MNNSVTQNLINDDYIMDVYTRMKQKHGQDIIILFHVGRFFESYFADSIIVAELGVKRVLVEKHINYVVYATRIPENELEKYRKRLYFQGYGTVVSEMLGKDGRYKLDSL